MKGLDGEAESGNDTPPSPPPLLDYQARPGRRAWWTWWPAVVQAAAGYACYWAVLWFIAVLRPSWQHSLTGLLALMFSPLPALLCMTALVTERKGWHGFGIGVALGFISGCLIGGGAKIASPLFGF